MIVQNALDNVNHRQFITTGAAEGQKRCLKSKKLLERYLAQTPYGCNACGAGPQVLSLCNGCKVRGYCNRECQLKDWKTHKKVCGKEEVRSRLRAQQRAGTGNTIITAVIRLRWKLWYKRPIGFLRLANF